MTTVFVFSLVAPLVTALNCRDGEITFGVDRRRMDLNTSTDHSRPWCEAIPQNFCTFPELKAKCCRCGGGEQIVEDGIKSATDVDGNIKEPEVDMKNIPDENGRQALGKSRTAIDPEGVKFDHGGNAIDVNNDNDGNAVDGYDVDGNVTSVPRFDRGAKASKRQNGGRNGRREDLAWRGNSDWSNLEVVLAREDLGSTPDGRDLDGTRFRDDSSSSGQPLEGRMRVLLWILLMVMIYALCCGILLCERLYYSDRNAKRNAKGLRYAGSKKNKQSITSSTTTTPGPYPQPGPAPKDDWMENEHRVSFETMKIEDFKRLYPAKELKDKTELRKTDSFCWQSPTNEKASEAGTTGGAPHAHAVGNRRIQLQSSKSPELGSFVAGGHAQPTPRPELNSLASDPQLPNESPRHASCPSRLAAEL